MAVVHRADGVVAEDSFQMDGYGVRILQHPVHEQETHGVLFGRLGPDGKAGVRGFFPETVKEAHGDHSSQFS